jgi:multidrug efflux pump subunit AcrB
MTTMAVMLGGCALEPASAPNWRPLGITIIGGLMVSQVLTLTTCVYRLSAGLQRVFGFSRR